MRIFSNRRILVSDIDLYGFCPERDTFYTVVCETCHAIVKPQALIQHMGMSLCYDVLTVVSSVSDTFIEPELLYSTYWITYIPTPRNISDFKYQTQLYKVQEIYNLSLAHSCMHCRKPASLNSIFPIL